MQVCVTEKLQPRQSLYAAKTNFTLRIVVEDFTGNHRLVDRLNLRNVSVLKHVTTNHPCLLIFFSAQLNVNGSVGNIYANRLHFYYHSEQIVYVVT